MPAPPRTLLARVLLVHALIAGCCAAARAACPGFTAVAGFAAGGAPQSIVSGDFNRDGIADLAIASSTGAPLAVLLGTGGGAFAAPVAYAGGTGAMALATSDFNGDGIADLAVCVSNGVAIWLGRGDGTFASAGIVSAGSVPRGIACADLDGDGIVDLAITSANGNCVLVLHGNGANGLGDGTFASPVAYAVGTAPVRIVAADLNNDGILDLVTTNNGSANLSVLRGLGADGVGDGTFAPAANVALPGSPWGLAVIDADGDGAPDLVASDGAGDALTLLRNDGLGHFPTRVSLPTAFAPRDIAAGDFDGDGLPDVAVACAGGNAVSVLRGTGGGAFAALGTYAAGSGAAGLVACDLNGDGALDLACANSGAASISRWLGSCPAPAGAAVSVVAPNGGEAWWPGAAQTVRWTRGPGVTAVDVDLSRDGGASWLPLARGTVTDHAVVPAVGSPSDRLRVRVRDAGVPSRADASDGTFDLCGLFREPIASDAGLSATLLALADLDGDGVPDLVACDATRARVLRGLGDGRFTIGATVAMSAPVRARLVDADGDGVPDLVTLEAGGLCVRAGDGAGGFGAPATFAVAGGADFTAGDFCCDGTTGFAVLAADPANPAGSRVDVLGRTGGAWTSRWHASLDGAPRRIVSADFDGDGIADLAIGAGTTLQLWRGQGAGGRGDGTFAPVVVRTLATAAGDLLAGSFSGAGRLDVAACVPATGDVWTFANAAPSGSASPPLGLAAPLASAAGASPESPVTCDFDGDGHADVAVALAGAGRVAVLPGVAGGFGAARTFDVGGSPHALLVGDVDGDGRPDLVVAVADSARVVVLPAMCPPRSAATLALAPPADVTVGFARPLRWMRSHSVPLARVDLSRDDGRHWRPLAGAVACDSLLWAAAGPPTDSARVRVCDAGCPTRASTSARFAIRVPLGAPRLSPGAAGPARAMAVADADGSGAGTAIVAAVADDSSIMVLRGAGDGGFVPLATVAEPGVRALRLADLDGDGRPELLALHDAGLSLRRGLGGGAFGPPQTLATDLGCRDLAVGDFDGDGVADLAIVGGVRGVDRVALLRGLGVDAGGAFAFGPATDLALPALPAAVVAADVNGDGIADLAVTHALGLSVLLGGGTAGRGDGSFRLVATRPFGSGGARSLVAGDFDSDGRLDLAAADSAGSALIVAAGDGAGGFAPVACPLPGAPGAVAWGDFDGDSLADFAVTLAGGALALVRGTGAIAPGALTLADTLGAGAAPAALAMIDTDGDGAPDLVAGAAAGGLVVTPSRARAGTPRLAPADAAPRRVGDRVTLHWSTRGLATDVQLSRDGGTRWQTIATALPGTSWRWNVTGPATALARLRVRDAFTPGLADTASAPFDLEPLALDAPAGPRAGLALGAPWPNPSRGAVTLELSLPEAGRIDAEVCDVGGRRVTVLAAGARPAGTHLLRWDGRDARGAAVPPGLYFVRVRAAGRAFVRRVARLA